MVLFEDPNMFTGAGNASGTITMNADGGPTTDLEITSASDSAVTITVVTADWSVTAATDGLIFNNPVWGNSYNAATDCDLPYEITWEELKRRERAEERRKKKAKERAQKLLKRHLTPKQWLDYEAYGHFFVKTPKGHLYQIGSARDHNIVRLNKRRKAMRVLCVSIYEVRVPVEDIMLAQKLMLETQEDSFLKIANHWATSTARGLRRAA